MGCQQGIVLSEKSKTKLKQLILKPAALLKILAGRRIHTLHMPNVVHMDQSLDKVIFHGLRKCSKPTRPNQPVVYRAYVEVELLCSVKCIYAYLVQRSEIVTQDFTEFFTTFGKPHHPVSKDSLARWLKEVMGNADLDTEIFKPHSTRIASKQCSI